MNDTSRRKFLAAAGVGTAAGAAAVVGGAGSPASAATTSGGAAGRGAGEPVVAFVEDPRADKVVLMFGEQEVEVRDRDLAARILRAAGGGR